MKFALATVLALALFVLAASGLWKTVGGLVEQAGARDDRAVDVDVSLALVDANGQPMADVPVRVVLGRPPQEQPTSAGQSVATDATGRVAFTTKATIDKTARTRPTNFLDSLFAKAEPTDHVAVGVELPYMTFRWMYVADFYRFGDGDVVWPEGLSLFSRDAQGRFTRRATAEGSGWKIDDLGAMRLTTQGHELTQFGWEPVGAAGDHWRLALTFRRHAEPVVR